MGHKVSGEVQLRECGALEAELREHRHALPTKCLNVHEMEPYFCGTRSFISVSVFLSPWLPAVPSQALLRIRAEADVASSLQMVKGPVDVGSIFTLAMSITV